MAFDVEAAKADGYTDEEIQQYLATKEQPLPEEKPIDRGEEMGGTAMAMAPLAVGVGIGAGALGYGVKKLSDAWRGGPAPTPTAAPGSPASMMKTLTGSPSTLTMPQGAVAPEGAPMGAGDKWSSKVVGGMGPGGDSVTEAARNYQLQKGLSPAEAAKYGVNRGGLIVPNQMPPATPPAAPVAAPVQQAAPTAGNFIERMNNLAKTYGPVAQQATSKVGQVIAPVARVLGSAPVMGAQLMAHSPSLGPQVPSAGPARGSELNPATGRPWTAQELQQYNAQY